MEWNIGVIRTLKSKPCDFKEITSCEGFGLCPQGPQCTGPLSVRNRVLRWMSVGGPDEELGIQVSLLTGP